MWAALAVRERRLIRARASIKIDCCDKNKNCILDKRLLNAILKSNRSVEKKRRIICVIKLIIHALLVNLSDQRTRKKNI